MKFNDKINMFYSNLDLIFKVKIGKVVRKGNDCYQVSKWIRWFFKLYYYGGIFSYVIFIIWVFIVEYISNNIYIISLLTMIIYLVLEFLLSLSIPIYKIKCWKTSNPSKIQNI